VTVRGAVLWRQEDVVTALALTGQTLMGQAVMVKSSEVRRRLCLQALGCNSSEGFALVLVPGLLREVQFASHVRKRSVVLVRFLWEPPRWWGS